MLNNNTTQKKRLFLDMDGVLAEYRSFESPEQYLQPGYYESLKPHKNVIEGIKQFKKENPDVEIYVISAYYVMPGAVAPQEKRNWLQEHFPEIDSDHIIFTPCGEPKENYIEGGIGNGDYILDDYSYNLENFSNSGGNAIKLLNGINSKRGSWQGNQLSYREKPFTFAKALKDIIVNEKSVRHSIEEVQLRNEKEGLTLYINKDELTNIVNRYFPEFHNVEDFRANATEEHWGVLKRIATVEAPSAEIVPHVSLGQFKYEFNTFKSKFDDMLTSQSMRLKNKSDTMFAIKENTARIGALTQMSKDDTVLQQYKATIDVEMKKATNVQNAWKTHKKELLDKIKEMVEDFFDKHDNLDEDEKEKFLAENGVTVLGLKEQLLKTIAQKELEFEIFDKVELEAVQALYNNVNQMYLNKLAGKEVSCADAVLDGEGTNEVPVTSFETDDILKD